MKKLKSILFILILGAMTYGGTLAYNYATMTDQERLLMENVEALTQKEGGGIFHQECYHLFSSYVSSIPYNICGEVSSDPNVFTQCAGISNYKPSTISGSGICYKYQ